MKTHHKFGLYLEWKKSKIELNINLKKKIIECSHDGFSKIFKIFCTKENEYNFK